MKKVRIIEWEDIKIAAAYAGEGIRKSAEAVYNSFRNENGLGRKACKVAKEGAVSTYHSFKDEGGLGRKIAVTGARCSVIVPGMITSPLYTRIKTNEAGEIKESNFVADLNVHPMHAFEGYVSNNKNIEKIIDVMSEKDVDAIGVIGYPGRNMWQKIEAEIIKYGKSEDRAYKEEKIGNTFRFSNNEKNFYLIKGDEITSKQGISFIVLGHNGEITANNLEDIARESRDKNGIVIINTPFVDDNSFLSAKRINKEAEKQLYNLCENKNTRPDAIEWNAYCIRYLRKILNGRDVNEEAETLADKYNIPLVATTGLQARKLRHLNHMATSFIAIPEKDIGKGNENITEAIKNNITNYNFGIHQQYTSELCLADTFAVPMINGTVRKTAKKGVNTIKEGFDDLVKKYEKIKEKVRLR